MRISYLVSFGASAIAALTFLLITSLTGGHTPLTRIGGTLWVFLLSLIIALPTVTPAFKRRYRQR
ncbi:MAG: hypothetical protein HYX87_01920 [Chloroflexi bacterium]|nr:hypothetical protein [Chloroflexota bacterium]